MKLTILFLCLLLLVPYVYGGEAYHKIDTLELNIDDWGDTAQVSKITPTLAIMGFEYLDTVSYQPDTTAHQTISWTSPQQIMTFTLAGNTGDLLVLDTVGIGVVGCTISFQAQDLGVSYDLSTGADSTIATAYDSIVARFNLVAALTDSVDAQDSGTYIKFVSLIGEGVLKGPWTMLMSTDSTDTASAIDSVTIAMICDSMTTAINADAGLDSFMTAFDSTTFYITQSDDKGVLFYHTFLNHADTHGTLVASQANVTANSEFTDTILLIPTTNKFRDHYTGIYGTFILDSSLQTDIGVGLSDSVQITLATGRNYRGTSLELFELDSATQAPAGSLPCTLRVSHDPAVAGADTLIKENWYLIIHVSDTANDTTNYLSKMPFWIDYIMLKDD